MDANNSPALALDSPIVLAAEQYVISLLSDNLTEDHLYHNLPHTLSVKNGVIAIAKSEGIEGKKLEILQLAALFHDCGFINVYDGHEKESQKIAEQFLRNRQYQEEDLIKVLECIDATIPSKEPVNKLEKIIKDADLINLSSNNYPVLLTALRHEWSVFMNSSFEDPEWYEMNAKFLKDHHYYTKGAVKLFDEKKNANRKYLKKMAKKEREKNAKLVDKGKLTNNKSAQMMFKTSLRNHLDLSTLADNKANIMLSVNAGIITIGMPLAVTYIQGNYYLLIPIIGLLFTCLVSMIFATLATRPISMTGDTTDEKIKKGESNLFFFGNFYKMDFKRYQEGMNQVIEDEEKLENSIQRDLFFLGKSLGTKYRQLRICYNVFMVGIIASVLLFFITYRIFVM
ncbi:MAG: Pycsar system effector family protein [Bacteroidota bacterium]